MELIDTHCHPNLEPLSAAVDAVLARAREAGVRVCISIGTTLDDSRANVELARREPMIRAAVGVHPHEADGVTDGVLSALEELSHDPAVVAIGEVGLDQYRQHAQLDNQRRVFRAFIAMAQRRRLPLLIHCRQAYDELIATLRSEATPPVQGTIHCASGPPEFIDAALALGLHVSFAGNVTFPNAQALRALVSLVPDDRLLIETDAPFLAPQAVRGRPRGMSRPRSPRGRDIPGTQSPTLVWGPNEPAYLAHTAAYLAQLRGTTVEALGTLTSRNARRLFGLAEFSS